MKHDNKLLKTFYVILTVYLFLLAIKLLGHSFSLFGRGFAEAAIQMTDNPFAGLLLGIFATSLIQSSSTTTSIVVGMVAAGTLNLTNAIPIIMGANIGTTVTNILVSMGHLTNRVEFRRAFSASIVHDLFNMCTVLVLFPIEIHFNLIARIAQRMQESFVGAGGLTLFNPLKAILDPVIKLIERTFQFLPYFHIFLLAASLILLFVSLSLLIKNVRSLVLDKLELVINKYLFRNDFLGFIFGVLMTSMVQSSSVTTSLIVPLAGAGIISIRQIFPYTLGANIGTTVTAILAALATGVEVAVTIAFAHLVFNILGMFIFYPLKFIPIRLAEFIANYACRSKRNLILVISGFVTIHFIPVIFLLV